MTTEILSIGPWKNNAEMLADIAKLNDGEYLSGTVLDATYGEGAFWNDYRPARLVTNDLHKPADHAWDYRNMPVPDGHFGTVVFDPPYKLSGTPALPEQDARYGTTEVTSRSDVMNDIRLGALECYRVARKYLLVKCMDQVEGGRMRWQTDMVTRALEDVGAWKVDRFDMVAGGRPQPGGRRQLTARHQASQLLVFRRRPLGNDGQGSFLYEAP